MSAAPGDRGHADARRYLTRRMERALLLGDPRGGPDAARTPGFWVLVGAALAALLTAATMALELLRPAAQLGAEPIVMDRETGALYARIDDVLHPALNLTSARLATGSAEQPRAVGHEAIDAAKRGAPIGIPGAPQRLGPALSEAESQWTVCDGGHTTIIAGAAPGPSRGGGTQLPAPQSILARGPNGATHLLYDGRRSAVALDDPAVRRALRLEGATPVPVSAALLGLVPEAAPLVVPPVPGRGNPGPSGLPGTRIGDVVRVERGNGAEHFVVLAGGVQPVGAVVADLLTFADAGREVPTWAAPAVAGVPTVGVLAVAGYPDRLHPPVPDPAAVCATWRPDGAVHLKVGDAAPVEGAIRLAQADGDGPAVDEVYLPPGRSLFVRPERDRHGATLVSESGVRFPLADPDAAGLLGLPEAAVPAPWAVVSALPAGPPLGRAQASVARDVVAPAAARQGGGADE